MCIASFFCDCSIVDWYMGGKWILTAADGHLALLAIECHLNCYQQTPI